VAETLRLDSVALTTPRAYNMTNKQSVISNQRWLSVPVRKLKTNYSKIYDSNTEMVRRHG